MKTINRIDQAIVWAHEYLYNTGKIVEAKKWQGIDSPAPMFEAMDLSFRTPMPESIYDAEQLILPNLPWAETHFQERISGSPMNPPPSHEIWPFGQKNNQAFTSDTKFDHTYPERFWPKYAGENARWETVRHDGPTHAAYARGPRFPNEGIRFEYGDLKDVIAQLEKDHTTRQAYLPIFFPEDTGANGGKGRVPCTIGYHFMIRDNYLHIGYLMRSCDAFRHFRDDLYMAVRLGHHILNSIEMAGLKMGYLKFTAYSFHIFGSEQKLLNKKISSWKDQAGK